MFFSHHIIINMEVDGDIMDVILNNQIKSGRPRSTSMSKVGEVAGLNGSESHPKYAHPKLNKLWVFGGGCYNQLLRNDPLPAGFLFLVFEFLVHLICC